jgi:hypothetical protein
MHPTSVPGVVAAQPIHERAPAPNNNKLITRQTLARDNVGLPYRFVFFLDIPLLLFLWSFFSAGIIPK